MTEPIRREDYLFLRALLREKVGHDLVDGKEYLAESRLGRLAVDSGLPGLPALFDRLRKGIDPALAAAACEAMLTGETSFFRSRTAFERLRSNVIPALLQARASTHRLRIWSAACSTGQEPYSLAMLLLDDFPEVRAWDVRILATDISRAALAQAESGAFSEGEARRGLADETVRRHLESRGGRWVVSKPIRSMVTFARRNLLDAHPDGGPFDLILIRNVLIYLTVESRTKIFESVRQVIADDGYLFLGESETILGQETSFVFAEGGLDCYRPGPSRTKPFGGYSY